MERSPKPASSADFLPDDISGYISPAIEAGMAAMQRTLDALGV